MAGESRSRLGGTWRQAVASLRERRVAVIGDAMLDAFLWGDATRISPEAPVPVVLLERQTWTLGGAANVAANIASLGGHAVLFAPVGRDVAGTRLRELAADSGIETGALLTVPRPTTVKFRVFARNKHLMRLDRESASPLAPALVGELAAALEARDDIEAVVLSDYAKGTVTAALARRVARYCEQRDVPWCVDPKRATIRYGKATVLKPNRTELAALSGLPVMTREQLRRAAARVMRKHGCGHLLVTCGAQGMMLFAANGKEQELKSSGQAVSDVTGAGDTVSAVVGLGLAAGMPVPAIAELANRAGGYVVTQPGIALARARDLV